MLALVFALSIVSLTCQALTCTLDPGVIPPSKYPALEHGTLPPEQRAAYERDHHGQWRRRVAGTHTQGAPGVHHPGSVPTEQVERYCYTCHIWRAPRVSHCQQCGFCMERYDHHCHLMSTCIARRNHQFFTCFLLSAQAACILLVLGVVHALHTRGFPSAPSTWNDSNTYVLLGFGVLCGYHAALLLFGVAHCVNLCCDITTKEYMQHTRGAPMGPCRAPPGWWAQRPSAWAYVCCAPLQWRSRVGKPVDEYYEHVVEQGGRMGGEDCGEEEDDLEGVVS